MVKTSTLALALGMAALTACSPTSKGQDTNLSAATANTAAVDSQGTLPAAIAAAAADPARGPDAATTDARRHGPRFSPLLG